MIRVNDDYVIDVDSMCYTTKIDKHKTDKKVIRCMKWLDITKTLTGQFWQLSSQ